MDHSKTLTVSAPPNPPKILQGANISLRAGESVSLKCESLGGKPAADIFWIDGDGNTVTSGKASLEHSAETSVLRKERASLRFSTPRFPKMTLIVK